ncbi:MAG: HD domain-containing protein [Bacteroidales bacterium]|jgi:class 3 adenylate cyclase/predicted metal-dependent HD superfamily phosphohydrolase|nr:HD domain-containing protein [Bacteroidales bacterium]
MESGSKQQLLKRIASLVSENKDLKEKQRTLAEAYNRLAGEVDEYKERIEKAKAEQGDAGKPSCQQTRFDAVTILYAEVQGLSDVVTATNTSEHMDRLDDFFLRFNAVVEKYQLVKLHSIGDRLICAGGIPEKNITSPITVTLAALEMLHTVETDLQNSDDPVWGLNIGIHTGTVTALVSGHKRSTCDLKGDTVHVASRIGSVGKENTVVISATTYELVKELFRCCYAGVLPVKYRNRLDLFTVTGIKSEFSADTNGYLPNDEFRTQLMLVQFSDLQEHVLDRLEKGLPKYLYYHNVKHTVDVVTESELIGWAEGLNDRQLLLLKTAALFHDTGHIISYAGHEERSVDIARETLPKYNYTPEEIDRICRIIMATKLPPQPGDLLEAIICDSDLDYLGRTDFVPVSNALYAELKAQNKSLSLNDWNQQQLKFIGSHQYFTKTGRKLREVKKQEQIERIKQLIE